ncbi:MAG: tRNA uridine-5-carboxymethylaminomethyl(34) synthesis GTPase MnmE [Candidatus Omnitrophica bacterium]|nr:tRNA uridine-5-carboxymethylaminomethyl(34) synthesis GTPase MnmE [Candidatus Omnitrophota bacterium]MDD5436921.1 tRNA uridine-5-carboxymethylaminomethyl(34) synthesis GTPase MnmE [Candidatus Omnitrophota bacterium]
MNKINPDDTIVAISTPIGEGGISIVRLSGTRAIKIADGIFRAKDGGTPSRFETYTTHYGWIAGGPHAKVVDEVILTVMKAPKSYTKEDIVEINCHGGNQAVKKVMDLTLKLGARLAEPGEFTKRAFLNGRIDLTQAEAVLDVIRAKTEGSLKVAMGQLEGELSASVSEILKDVTDITAEVEAAIDFPDEELEFVRRAELLVRVKEILAKIRGLVESYDNGMVFREGVLAIICGKPNVGKSSLMNLLLKRDRVIVSPVPGTTRDAVEETINLNGIPVRLVDTAGISETRDILEKESVKRSKKYLELSDIAILMLDASTPMGKADKEIAGIIGGKKKIVLLNKIDLVKKAVPRKLKERFKGDVVIEISVKNKKGIERLEKAIERSILSGAFNQGESAVVSNARHKEALDKAYGSMLSVNKALEESESPEITAIDLKEAIFNLGLVVGKSVSDDILDRIFSRFCIGK